MTPYFSDAGLFLIDTVLGFYILIVMLRFLLQLTRADFYNPISQFVVKITNPPLTRLRRVIPGFWGIDLAAVVLLIALESLPRAYHDPARAFCRTAWRAHFKYCRTAKTRRLRRDL